jgi:hypothetical protein
VKEPRYSTGDRHPEHEYLAFVRYDENGDEEWTSSFFDPSAPFRLAARKTQDGPEYKSSDRHNMGTESSLLEASHRAVAHGRDHEI